VIINLVCAKEMQKLRALKTYGVEFVIAKYGRRYSIEKTDVVAGVILPNLMLPSC
jgi:hypothetical protein